MRTFIAIAVFCAFGSGACPGDVLHVDSALGTGAGDGSSWENAFRGRLGLQFALAVAEPGDEIWVADGVYAPAAPGGDRRASFLLEDGVAILGGFSGGEKTRDERRPGMHPAVLTGDLNSNTVETDNSYHVVTAGGVGRSAVLDGFVVTSGVTEAAGLVGRSGGGAQIMGSPVIRNCTFQSNSAEWRGGDIAVLSGEPLIDSCVFTGTSEARAGLALYHGGPSAATVRACRFVGEPPTTGGMAGIGIMHDATSAAGLTVEGCEFSLRTREFSCPAGVGIYATAGSRLTVTWSRFINNLTCGGGGGIHCDGIGSVDRCVFAGNEGQFDGGAALFSFEGELTVTNCLFTGNDREGFSTISAQGTMRFANCTFVHNGAPTRTHGVVLSSGVGTSFTNCVFWGNRTGAGDPVIIRIGSAPPPRFDHSLVQGWNGSLPGAGSFTADPLFVDAPGPDGVAGTPDDDVRLAPGSPCIDRGLNSVLPTDVDRDLAGACRFADDPATVDAGFAPPPEVDLGAYEFRGGACRADVTCDGAVDSRDFFAFLSAFFTGEPTGDFNMDAIIDSRDFFEFLDALFAGC